VSRFPKTSTDAVSLIADHKGHIGAETSGKVILAVHKIRDSNLKAYSVEKLNCLYLAHLPVGKLQYATHACPDYLAVIRIYTPGGQNQTRCPCREGGPKQRAHVAWILELISDHNQARRVPFPMGLAHHRYHALTSDGVAYLPKDLLTAFHDGNTLFSGPIEQRLSSGALQQFSSMIDNLNGTGLHCLFCEAYPFYQELAPLLPPTPAQESLGFLDLRVSFAGDQ
jgi:hypothetical protein